MFSRTTCILLNCAAQFFAKLSWFHRNARSKSQNPMNSKPYESRLICSCPSLAPSINVAGIYTFLYLVLCHMLADLGACSVPWNVSAICFLLGRRLGRGLGRKLMLNSILVGNPGQPFIIVAKCMSKRIVGGISIKRTSSRCI